MTIKQEIATLTGAISNIKTEIINKGQSVSASDTVASLPSKIDVISNKLGENYSKSPLKDIIEGTIQYLYDTELDYVRPYMFSGCLDFTKAYFTNLIKICPHAFDGCFNFKTLVLDSDSIVYLEDSNAFNNTQINEIYVKDSLLVTYQKDTNWTSLKEKLKAISTLK